MNDVIPCPGCAAQLTPLPASMEDLVQCPRCRCTFTQGTLSNTSVTEKVRPILASVQRADDSPHDEPRRVVPLTTLRGTWFVWFFTLIIMATVGAYGSRALVEFESIGNAGGRNHNIQTLVHWQIHTTWFSYLCLAIWLYLVSKNARILQAPDSSATAIWLFVVGCIPLANLLLAYMHLQYVWQASDPDNMTPPMEWHDSKPSNMIRFWGLSCFVPTMAIFFGMQVGPGTDNADAIAIAASSIGVAISGLLLIPIIHLLIARQRMRYFRLYSEE